MNKISIIKKIQLGEKKFPIENLNSQLNFSFYCGKSWNKAPSYFINRNFIFIKFTDKQQPY